MKPPFALSLSFDGIRLLHRAAGGWRVLGEVALDVPDLGVALTDLRNSAKALEPGGITSKLLLPNDQIKFLTIPTPDMNEAARKDAALQALDGATPYAVDDLAFDISIEGDLTHVAAVARETLAEAEGFATEHQFNPVSFAAIPGDEAYLGEAFFGVTSAAPALLPSGEEVEPDGIAVVVIGTVEDAPAEGAEAAVLETPTAEDDVRDTQGEAPVQETPPTEETVAETWEMVADTPETIANKPEPEPEPESEPETTTQKAPAQGISAPAIPPAPAPTEQPIPEPIAAASIVEPAPPIGAPAVNVDMAEPTRREPTIGFASKRFAEKSAQPVLGGAQRGDIPAAPPPLLQGASVTSGHIAMEPEAEEPEIAPIEADLPPPVPPKAAPPASAPAGTVQKTATEQDRMTIFGARNASIGGKPRFLGLMLTTALLVFLAGMAAWASVFFDDGLDLSKLFGTRAPEVAEVEVPKLDTPLAEEAAPEVQTVSLDPALTAEDTAVLDALSEPSPPPPPLETADEAQITAKYAADGIWARAPFVPPANVSLIKMDNLYLASIDPISPSTDAVALPALGSLQTDENLPAVASPAAPGTTYEVDEFGRIVPTVEGALSPEGFTVYLGRPPLLPPASRTGIQPDPVDSVEPVIDPAIAAVRPKTRPSDLSETIERAQLDGLTRTELAALRPSLRPRSFQQQAAALAPAAAPEPAPVDTDAAVTEALTQPPDPEASATRLAAAASVRPDVRPRNFSRTVNRAQRAKPQRETRVASAAAIAPRTVTPQIPSTASVAKAATTQNAINLRNVNLIGVYGKPSSRRALVRLSSGRYKKVVVGDRVDGGVVSAIGEGELRYRKGGRDRVLKMPN